MADCPVCELHAESVFKIEGMDCHEEVAILEHRLKTLAGLEALDADVVGQRLRIQYDAAKLTTSRIAEAVAQTGMRAWLEHEEAVRPAPLSGASGSSFWRAPSSLLVWRSSCRVRHPWRGCCSMSPRSFFPERRRRAAPGRPSSPAASTSTF